MTSSPFDTGLDKNAANHVPLSPLPFLERAATVNPDKTAIIHAAAKAEQAFAYLKSFSGAESDAAPADPAVPALAA